MLDKRVHGIDIIHNPYLPFKIVNKETKEKEIVHMFQIGDTLFVSEELFNTLKNTLK